MGGWGCEGKRLPLGRREISEPLRHTQRVGGKRAVCSPSFPPGFHWVSALGFTPVLDRPAMTKVAPTAIPTNHAVRGSGVGTYLYVTVIDAKSVSWFIPLTTRNPGGPVVRMSTVLPSENTMSPCPTNSVEWGSVPEDERSFMKSSPPEEISRNCPEVSRLVLKVCSGNAPKGPNTCEVIVTVDGKTGDGKTGDRRPVHVSATQWRICFRWADSNAIEVEIVDYH
jgi:hypothetical protein